MQVLYDNDTWHLVPSLPHKWLSMGLQGKVYFEGLLNCCKAPVIAKGYSQMRVVEYDEMFSFLAKMTIMWIDTCHKGWQNLKQASRV